MLKSFKVKNFKSFKDEVEFSMEKGNTTGFENFNTIEEKELLKSALIFGANASGKSNVFLAMAKMKEIVFNSSTDDTEYQINVDTFKFDVYSKNEPVMFEIDFIQKDIEYIYGFEVLNEKINKEWLKRKIKSTVPLFIRENSEWESIKISHGFKEAENLKKFTRQNALFLSIASRFNIEIATEIKEWFKNFKILSSDVLSSSFTLNLLEKELEKTKIVNFLKTADLGIEDLVVEKEEMSSETVFLPSEIKRTLSEIKEGRLFKPIIKSVHKVYDKENNHSGNVELDFNFESEGTKKFLTLAGPIIDALENGKVLVIDELSSKLHYQLSDYIVRLFNSIDKNKNNAQLIFNSHLPLFLDNKEFRKDQIWFVEKDEYGKSKLYSLYDINVRKDLSYMKGYLLGKFGAVPDIREF